MHKRSRRTSAPESGDRFGPRHLDLFDDRLRFVLLVLQSRGAPGHYGDCDGQAPDTACTRLCQDARALARDSPRLVAEVRRAWSLIPAGSAEARLDDRELQWLSRLVHTLGRSLQSITPAHVPSPADVEALVAKLVRMRERLPR